MRNMKRIKSIFIGIATLICLISGMKIYNTYRLSKLPQIIVENHTDKILRVSNFQATSLTEETTEEDEYYAKGIYRIDPLDTQIYELRQENIEKNPNYLVIGYYSTINGIDYELIKENDSEYTFKNSGHIFFASIPTQPNSQPFCRFKVDIYEDKKVTINPIADNHSCEKKLYYYGTEGFRKW